MWVLKDNKKSKWHSYRISDKDYTNSSLERKELYTKEDDARNKIDLNVILEKTWDSIGIRDAAKPAMKEAIRQVLILASEKLINYVLELNKQSFEGWKKEEINGYKTASATITGFAQMIILDVNNLVV